MRAIVFWDGVACMGRRWIQVVVGLLVMGVIGVIWWHSMQNGVASHAESRRVLAWVLARIQGLFDDIITLTEIRPDDAWQ